MMGRAASSSLRVFAGSLMCEATRRGVPLEVAAQAARAMISAVDEDGSSDASIAARREAYFWATVRRTLIRGRRRSTAMAHMVLSAVVKDLRRAGRDSLSVWRELELGWSDKVPSDVLEEYRMRLCS